MNYQTKPGEYVEVDGMLVETDALRIAESIKQYDPNLEILCVDPDLATDISEAPFVIAEYCRDGILRPIFSCWQLDNTVLERVRGADTNQIDLNASIDKMRADLKLQETRRYEEKRLENKDIVQHIAGMKSKYTVRDSQTGELITFYDDRPSTRS